MLLRLGLIVQTASIVDRNGIALLGDILTVTGTDDFLRDTHFDRQVNRSIELVERKGIRVG